MHVVPAIGQPPTGRAPSWSAAPAARRGRLPPSGLPPPPAANSLYGPLAPSPAPLPRVHAQGGAARLRAPGQLPSYTREGWPLLRLGGPRGWEGGGGRRPTDGLDLADGNGSAAYASVRTAPVARQQKRKSKVAFYSKLSSQCTACALRRPFAFGDTHRRSTAVPLPTVLYCTHATDAPAQAVSSARHQPAHCSLHGRPHKVRWSRPYPPTSSPHTPPLSDRIPSHTHQQKRPLEARQTRARARAGALIPAMAAQMLPQ